MLIDKKYLDKDYIGKLCVGCMRYNINESDSTFIILPKFLSYIINENININDVLIQVYETEQIIYLKIYGSILNIKIHEPNLCNEDIKQKLINLYENKIDDATFNIAFKFINGIFGNIKSNKIVNSILEHEFNLMLKYIVLNKNLIEIKNLRQTFYENPNNNLISYDKIISNLFKSYENSLISKNITIDNDINNVMNALQSSQIINQEIRSIEIFRDIKFIEKKRVAILVGVSGSGKSMCLCHFAGEFMVTPKINTNKNIIFYFTFENSQEETFIRILANIVEVAIDDIKFKLLNENEKQELIQQYLSKIDKNTILKIIELDPKKYSMNTIKAEIHKELLKYSDAIVHSVILDYIDKMIPCDLSDKNKRHDQRMGDIVDDFKALVKEFECAGISVSQVNREGVKKSKTNEGWDMTNIGGSWEKVENADIVVTYDVQNFYEEAGYNVATFRNEKHRYFKDGSVITAILKPQYARLYNAPDNFNCTVIVKDDDDKPKKTKKDKTVLF